ncbi:hypothetical protein D4764_05G0008580 [Takifugu flavidus]|uniref:Uncharacterized protein n=1 Tax=Takifugu flavidus TaxID=433684 RepID=A0A5C6N1Z6_9TELE|nr:hypothetical protein D4764_05G0008580 [Takifugu flavidus]
MSKAGMYGSYKGGRGHVAEWSSTHSLSGRGYSWCYLQLLQPPGTSWVLSSDSQSALLQGLLDFSGLLIWERFRLYSVMVSKGWGHEVRGSGWAPGNSRAQADWMPLFLHWLPGVKMPSFEQCWNVKEVFRLRCQNLKPPEHSDEGLLDKEPNIPLCASEIWLQEMRKMSEDLTATICPVPSPPPGSKYCIEEETF